MSTAAKQLPRHGARFTVVARRDYLPDLSAQLPRHQRRRRRRPAGNRRTAGLRGSLGVEAIWISPFFKSPMADFGYDIADYRASIRSSARSRISTGWSRGATASAQGHHRPGVRATPPTSTPGSEESRQSRDNPKADWYVWADARDDGTPPNNWLSIFGGVAWTWEPRRGQYYLHNFLKSSRT
jgi:hypothetical protein